MHLLALTHPTDVLRFRTSPTQPPHLAGPSPQGTSFPDYPDDAERPEGEAEVDFLLRASEALKAEGNEAFKAGEGEGRGVGRAGEGEGGGVVWVAEALQAEGNKARQVSPYEALPNPMRPYQTL